MLSLLKSLIPGLKMKDSPAALLAGVTVASVTEALVDALPDHLTEEQESKVLQTVGWVSAGFGALALGLFVGAELRQRYKFNRRTPYDFYSHSNDEQYDMEFGVGV